MVFAITNQKGGVGKTTTVMNLGVYLSNKGMKVLLVDIDPQSNLTSGLGMKNRNEKNPRSIYDLLVNDESIKNVIVKTRIKNMELLPSSIELAGAEVEIVNVISRESILRKAIQLIKDEYDFILIDCPPSLGLLTVNGLVAADLIFIPVQTEYFALEGIGQLINTIKLIKSNLNPNLDIGGVILTMYDKRTNLSKHVSLEIKDFFGDKVFKTIIPRSIRLSEAPSHGLSIYEYDSSSKGADAYKKLADEIIKIYYDKPKNKKTA